MNITLFLLMVACAYVINLIANVANEIHGYMVREDSGLDDTHSGTNGLSRGVISLKESFFALFLVVTLSGILGLSIVYISGSYLILILGLMSVAAAILYSLTPFAFIKYPINEAVSGIFCGGVSAFSGALLQTGEVTLDIILFAVIISIATNFLMAVNNTADYHKDLENRFTLPHLIGFRNSMKLNVFEMVILVVVSFFINFHISTYIILFGIVYYFGYVNWLKGYMKIKEPYFTMKGEWITKALAFHVSMNILLGLNFLILGLLN